MNRRLHFLDDRSHQRKCSFPPHRGVKQRSIEFSLHRFDREGSDVFDADVELVAYVWSNVSKSVLFVAIVGIHSGRRLRATPGDSGVATLAASWAAFEGSSGRHSRAEWRAEWHNLKSTGVYIGIGVEWWLGWSPPSFIQIGSKLPKFVFLGGWGGWGGLNIPPDMLHTNLL